MSKTKIQMYLDIGLFASFFIVNMPQFTGIAIHEWLSFAFMPVILLHVVLNWKWIVNATTRFIKCLKGEVRFNYILDIALFILMVMVIFSGILISKEALPFLGFTIVINTFWVSLHSMSANLLMITMGIHLAMHWKWIVSTTNRYLFKRNAYSTSTAQESN